MTYDEKPVLFDCQGDRLVGIFCMPERPAEYAVLIVVGGPQYRSGSHRQFTLLARDLAADGIASLRFDYRGMGDSEGAMRDFESVPLDIRTALDTLLAATPDIQKVVIWGLCDAASAALLYAHTDSRITGLVLLNPWVYSEQGAAKTRLIHYYLAKLYNRSFWRKMLSGKVDLLTSAREIWRALVKIRGKSASADSPRNAVPETNQRENNQKQQAPLPDRLLPAFQRFQGRTLIILSGQDLVAKEFKDLCAADKKWKQRTLSDNVEFRELPEANHTFAARDWRNQVARWTREWVSCRQPS